MNLPFIRLPVLGQAASQAQNGSTSNMDNAEAPSTQTQANGTGNVAAADVAHGTTDVANQAQLYQDSSILFHFRDMQRRQVEFIKKRVLLLERGLYAEYQKEYFVSDYHFLYCLYYYYFAFSDSFKFERVTFLMQAIMKKSKLQHFI